MECRGLLLQNSTVLGDEVETSLRSPLNAMFATIFVFIKVVAVTDDCGLSGTPPALNHTTVLHFILKLSSYLLFLTNLPQNSTFRFTEKL